MKAAEIAARIVTRICYCNCIEQNQPIPLSCQGRMDEIQDALESYAAERVRAEVCQPCKELVLVGTDGCSKCEAGRVSMYTQGKLCFSCKLESVKLAEKKNA